MENSWVTPGACGARIKVRELLQFIVRIADPDEEPLEGFVGHGSGDQFNAAPGATSSASRSGSTGGGAWGPLTGGLRA